MAISRMDIEKLVHFIIVSARGCLDEPPVYGPLRLMETASKLLSLTGDSNHYQDLKNKIDEYKYLTLTNEEDFRQALDELVLYLAKRAKDK
ncbi:MAG: DUF6092 family protein [Bacillota bacterium]